MRRTVGILTFASVLVMSLAMTAAAGNITVVTFDEVPTELQAGTTYTFEYSFLSHGKEPMDIGDSSLRFRGPDGQELSFPGEPFEKGRVTADVVLPEAGAWSWELVSGNHVIRDLGTLPVSAPITAAVASNLLTALRIVLPVATALTIVTLVGLTRGWRRSSPSAPVTDGV